MPLFDPGVWNLTIYAGATFTQRATPDAGSVYNLTGYNARAMIRPTYTTTTPTLTLGTAAGTAVITLGGTAGWVQLDIDATTTAALGSAAGWIPTDYVWDLELVNGSDVTRFCYGVVSLSPESTR